MHLSCCVAKTSRITNMHRPLARSRGSVVTFSAAAQMTTFWWWTFGQVPELEATALHTRLEETKASNRERQFTPLVIDVRTEAEWKANHIEGAVNASYLPPWSFHERIEPLVRDVDKQRELYVICLSAHRSIAALKWLRGHGFKNVKQLQGGMQAWRKQALPEVPEPESRT